MMPLAEFGLFSYGQSLVLFAGVVVGTLILEPTSTVGTNIRIRSNCVISPSRSPVCSSSASARRCPSPRSSVLRNGGRLGAAAGRRAGRAARAGVPRRATLPLHPRAVRPADRTRRAACRAADGRARAVRLHARDADGRTASDRHRRRGADAAADHPAAAVAAHSEPQRDRPLFARPLGLFSLDARFRGPALALDQRHDPDGGLVLLARDRIDLPDQPAHRVPGGADLTTPVADLPSVRVAARACRVRKPISSRSSARPSRFIC